VVDEPQIRVDEPAVSTEETGSAKGSVVSIEGSGSIKETGSAEGSVSSIERIGSIGDSGPAEESAGLIDSNSSNDEISIDGVGVVSEGEQSSTDPESLGSTDGSSTDRESSGSTDESIISTADLRDVFNRLEVIVQKLARGGAVW